MDAQSRIVEQSPMWQGIHERIAYRLDTSRWGDAVPTSPSVTLYNSDGVNVTATYMTGSPTLSGQYIVCPVLHSLVEGQQYRMDIEFVKSGNTFEPWVDIIAQR